MRKSNHPLYECQNDLSYFKAHVSKPFNNNSENKKIILTCVMTTIYLVGSMNKQVVSNLYTCCVSAVLSEAGYLKFNK